MAAGRTLTVAETLVVSQQNVAVVSGRPRLRNSTRRMQFL